LKALPRTMFSAFIEFLEYIYYVLSKPLSTNCRFDKSKYTRRNLMKIFCDIFEKINPIINLRGCVIFEKTCHVTSELTIHAQTLVKAEIAIQLAALGNQAFDGRLLFFIEHKTPFIGFGWSAAHALLARLTL